MLRVKILIWLAVVMLSGCKGCVEQHDPTNDWKKFEEESGHANKPQVKLNEDGSIPAKKAAGEEVAVDPVDQKYSQFCASCHGANGGGDGPAGSALKPPPRNFVTWNDPKVTDEYIAKVIVEGGAAVGLSASMAPWGSVLSDEEVEGMVKKIRAYAK